MIALLLVAIAVAGPSLQLGSPVTLTRPMAEKMQRLRSRGRTKGE